MSNIRRLINELCPDGVQFDRLGDHGEFIRGGGIQKKDFVKSGIGCIHYGQLYTYYGISATQTKSFLNPEFAAKLRKAHPGNLVIATTSENDEDLGKAVARIGEKAIAVSGDAFIYQHDFDPKYVSFFLVKPICKSEEAPYFRHKGPQNWAHGLGEHSHPSPTSRSSARDCADLGWIH